MMSKKSTAAYPKRKVRKFTGGAATEGVGEDEPSFNYHSTLKKQVKAKGAHYVGRSVKWPIGPSWDKLYTVLYEAKNRGGYCVGSFPRWVVFGNHHGGTGITPEQDKAEDIDLFCHDESSFTEVCKYLHSISNTGVESEYAVSFKIDGIKRVVQVLKGFEGPDIYQLLDGICSPLSRIAFFVDHNGKIAVRMDSRTEQHIREKKCEIANCTNVAGIFTYLVKYAKKGYSVDWEQIQKPLAKFMYMDKDEQLEELTAYGRCELPWIVDTNG